MRLRDVAWRSSQLNWIEIQHRVCNLAAHIFWNVGEACRRCIDFCFHGSQLGYFLTRMAKTTLPPGELQQKTALFLWQSAMACFSTRSHSLDAMSAPMWASTRECIAVLAMFIAMAPYPSGFATRFLYSVFGRKSTSCQTSRTLMWKAEVASTASLTSA